MSQINNVQIEFLLDPERQRLASKYTKLSRRLSLAELLIIGTLLPVLILSGVSVRLSQLLTIPQPWASALYFIILVMGLGIIMMPLSYYQSFILTCRYGLSNQKFSSWLADRAKATSLSILLGLGIVILIYWLLESFPSFWWFPAGLSIITVSLLLTRLTPTLLLSFFFKLEPVDDIDPKNKLMNLAKQARTRAYDVFTINLSGKSTTTNAMLAGLSNSKRIIPSDTMLQQYSPEEIEVVMAHELGHHIHRDIPKLIAAQSTITLLSFFFANLTLKTNLAASVFYGVSDVTAFPLLILVLAAIGLITIPLINIYSRSLETAVAIAALELTAKPEAFISAITKLTDKNLSDAQPNRWAELLLHDHPFYFKRVNLAYNYLKKPVGETIG